MPIHRLAAFLLLAALAAGCGGNPQITGCSLSGVVRHNGAPLPGGEIRVFDPADPNKSMGTHINADGTFQMPNAPVGNLKVLIDTEVVKSHPSLMGGGPKGAGKMPDEVKSAQAARLKFVPINKKYNDVAVTPLTVETKKGTNAKDFEVD